MSHTHSPGEVSFSGLGLSPKILEALARLKFTTPTPIQHQAIPVAAQGKDVIGIAQTGTGKTLAFALPLLQQISQTKKQGLILLPTRELAVQVEEAIRKVGASFGLKTAVIIGGASMYNQLNALRRGPHIVIGTPGRICDHLERKSLSLKNVGVLILDEADRMLDMGFMPQIQQILQHVPKERQTLLFSATMPPAIVQIAAKYMKLPVQVEVAPAGTIAEKIEQELFIIPRDQKNRLLDKLLKQYTGTVLVFSRTKYGAKKICRSVNDMGHRAAEIHSNLSLSQRQRSLRGFKTGEFRVLIATDIAARGIDVTDIELVINYDLPDNLDDYVHRVGRTGRAGKTGRAISFVTPDQRGKIRIIERLVKVALKISPLPELPAGRVQTYAPTYQQDRRSSDSYRHRGPSERTHGRDKRRSGSGHGSRDRNRQPRVHL